MSSDKQKSLQAMRTFARDVERERSDSDTTESGATDKKTAPKESSKAETVTGHRSTDKKNKTKTIKENIVAHEPEKTTTKKPAHIPAFHELQKAANDNLATTRKDKKATQPKSKKPGITPSKTVHGGTIITDTKKDKPSFFSELNRSISNWFNGLRKSLTHKKKPTYTVTQTERRKGVVQKATSKTGTIFSADSDTLKEQIKARQRAESREHEEDDINWSPYTEPGYPLLGGEETESADPRVTAVSVTPKTNTVAKKRVPAPVIKSTKKIPELQPEPDPVPDLDEKETELTTTASPETVSQPSATPVSTTAEPEADVVKEQQFEEEIPDEEDRDNKDSKVTLKDTNTLALLVVGLVLGIGIVSFAVISILNLTNNTSIETDILVTPLSTATRVTDLTMERLTYNALQTAVNRSVIENAPDQTHEYQFVSPRDEVISGSLLFDVIYSSTSSGFRNNVSQTRFVESDAGHRAFLFQTSDVNAALGGMFTWEPSLLSDIGGLLDISNLPPNVGEFTDIQVNDFDARVLKFEERDLLVYLITADDVVVIANHVDALLPFTE